MRFSPYSYHLSTIKIIQTSCCHFCPLYISLIGIVSVHWDSVFRCILEHIGCESSITATAHILIGARIDTIQWMLFGEKHQWISGHRIHGLDYGYSGEDPTRTTASLTANWIHNLRRERETNWNLVWPEVVDPYILFSPIEMLGQFNVGSGVTLGQHWLWPMNTWAS